MSAYPKYAPLGWPFTEEGFWEWAKAPEGRVQVYQNDRHFWPYAYIDYLRAEGREDEVPCLDGLVALGAAHVPSGQKLVEYEVPETDSGTLVWKTE